MHFVWFAVQKRPLVESCLIKFVGSYPIMQVEPHTHTHPVNPPNSISDFWDLRRAARTTCGQAARMEWRHWRGLGRDQGCVWLDRLRCQYRAYTFGLRNQIANSIPCYRTRWHSVVGNSIISFCGAAAHICMLPSPFRWVEHGAATIMQLAWCNIAPIGREKKHKHPLLWVLHLVLIMRSLKGGD